MTSIEAKDILIKHLDVEMLEVIPEEDIEADVNNATTFEIQVNTELNAIRNYLRVKGMVH